VNIYLRMEVRARELEARLLLGLTAAERGHTVLLGDLRDLLSHRLWLSPGIYHDKSLTPAPRKLALHARLVDAGFLVTSQDEEHGLLQDSYDAFAEQRFSSESLAQTAAVLAWGDRDASVLSDRYPDASSRIHATGSPRVDLWRPELDPFHTLAVPSAVTRAGRYVLVASNVGITNANPFWVNLREQRAAYFRGEDDPTEFAHYEHHAMEFRYLAALVRTLRSAAAAMPHVQFVVRPHPTEADGAWEDLLGPVANIVVTRDGPIGPWIRRAVAVVHNGSTTGLEAAVGGVPVISFQPNGERSELLSNRLGRVARDASELIAAIEQSEMPANRSGWYPPATADLLEERICALRGRAAADRIVDVWEEIERPGLDGVFSPSLRHRASAIHAAVGRVRHRRGSKESAAGRFRTDHKFPPFAHREVERIAARLESALGRFHGVRTTTIAPRVILLRPPR
jgi:surface carbohydrate biosynthesis protein